jgi:hypothetical protein
MEPVVAHPEAILGQRLGGRGEPGADEAALTATIA